MAYISESGNWGSEDVLLVDDDSFTQKQWELIGELPDYEKYLYAQAILAGADLDEWEQN